MLHRGVGRCILARTHTNARARLEPRLVAEDGPLAGLPYDQPSGLLLKTMLDVLLHLATGQLANSTQVELNATDQKQG